jgi:hypothetical protein
MNEREANPNPFVLQFVHDYDANGLRYIAFIRSLSKKRDHTVSSHDSESANLKDAEMILKAVGELDFTMFIRSN